MNAPAPIAHAADAQLRIDDALEELKRSRERMDAMLENIGDAFFAVDREWRIIYANRKATSFVCIEMRDALGLPLLEVAPALEGSSLMDCYRQAMASGQPGIVEACWDPPGDWVEARAYPTPDGL